MKLLRGGGAAHTCLASPSYKSLAVCGRAEDMGGWPGTNVPPAVFGRALVSHGMCFSRWPVVQALRAKTSLSSFMRKHKHWDGVGGWEGRQAVQAAIQGPDCPWVLWGE